MRGQREEPDDDASPIRLRTADGVDLVGYVRQGRVGTGDGSPTACVIVHGFTGSSLNPQVARICRTLAARGFTVLAPDLRGHGASGGASTAGADEIHDVAAAVAWLRAEGYDSVATLGWSMGGSAVLRHAGLGGDTDAVVAISAAGTWWERGTRPMRLVHWMFESRTGRVATRVVRRTRVARGPWDPIPEAPADVVGRIAPRPLLIVHGDADHYFPMTHVDALAAAAPDATVWREVGMGHAETATGAQLLERIGGWVAEALAPTGDPHASDRNRQVCHDGRRVDGAARE